MLLFLLAAGLSLVFGLLGVVNFAHGALYMLGAYVALQISSWTGSFWLALVIAPLAVALLGGVLERLTLRMLYGRDQAYQLLLTFGYILVIEEFIRIVWGVNFRSIDPPPLLSGTSQILGSTVADYRIFVLAIGAIVSVALYLIIEKSHVGIVVRAASANSAMVSCLGIDVARVRTGVFMAGTALAALSGVIAAPLLPLKLGMSFSIIIDCFMVVVIGGLGNIRGAILSAMLIGIVRAISQEFVADWIFLLTYGLLILTLIFRPEGIFNIKVRQA